MVPQYAGWAHSSHLSVATCNDCHVPHNNALEHYAFKAVEELLVEAHIEAKAAWESGATEREMTDALQLIRHAQWRWDFATAGHGFSFHAPLEVAAILSSAVEKVQSARLVLARVLANHGVAANVMIPDISTKEKAQTYLGLDMETLRAEKKKFLETIVPQWDAEAAQREARWKKSSQEPDKPQRP